MTSIMIAILTLYHNTPVGNKIHKSIIYSNITMEHREFLYLEKFKTEERENNTTVVDKAAGDGYKIVTIFKDGNLRSIQDRRNSIADFFYKQERICHIKDNDTIKCSCPDFTPYKSKKGKEFFLLFPCLHGVRHDFIGG